ncbi:hypothetical protein DXG03_009688 [Asterophora parasitica]|uniref:Peptidase M48 domain-containing protein n=1 Tax=Asterophora parasitica TaxID=117018 RepID=A0A9P7KAT9_9AGAR|nr:hypothetical protein DXG03_009688 [Asterophora parasitica]
MFRSTAARLLRHTPSSRHSVRFAGCGPHTSPIATIPLNTTAKSRSFSSSRPFRARIEYVRFGVQPPGRGKRPQIDPKLKIIGVVSLLGVVYYVAHLEQIPETGRWRFMNTSLGFEEKFGRMARDQTIQEYEQLTLPPHHPLSRHVRRVVTRILAASNLGHIRGESSSQYTHGNSSPVPYHGEEGGEIPWDPDARMNAGVGEGKYGHKREWEVIVVNDPKMVNAQAVPVARHSAERISSQTVAFILLFIAQVLGIDMGLSNVMQSLLLELPNSRTQELEADKIGMNLMARACIDPRGAVE